ncbi:MAG: hypothetical protein JSC161_000411 [Candidatus Tokpelaia sp. JSC161]|jgi:hypothetical protein|nr:MAG: hypothetical protein JSC161_000411 [Candidatus Tokpelaia sp. JSC161]
MIGSGFVLAKPILISFIKRKMKNFGIEAESSNISLLGKMSLKKLRITMNNGNLITIGTLQCHIPFLWNRGQITLYNVLIKKDTISLTIPKIEFKQINQPTITQIYSLYNTHNLLLKVRASDIHLPEVKVTSNQTPNEIIIHNITIDQINHETIRNIRGLSLDSRISSSQKTYQIHSETFSLNEVEYTSKSIQIKEVKVNHLNIKTENLDVLINLLKSNNLLIEPETGFLSKILKPLSYTHSSKIQDFFKSTAIQSAEVKGFTAQNKNLQMIFSSLKINLCKWNLLIPHDFFVNVKDIKISTHEQPNFFNYQNSPFSLSGHIAWIPHKNLLFHHILFSEKKSGMISFQGTILNFEKAFFNGNFSHFQKIAISTLKIRLIDTGLIQHFLDWEQTKINISKNELHQILYEIAIQTPYLLLKKEKNTESIAYAFGAFIRGDSHILHMILKSKTNKGISLSDLSLAQQNPSSLLKKIIISVITEK